MSKKDFIALADAIREHNRLAPNFGGKQFHESQIAILANFCQAQNYNFKRDRWLDYVAGKCGQNGGKVSGGKAAAEYLAALSEPAEEPAEGEPARCTR